MTTEATTTLTTEAVEATRRIVRNMAEQMLRHAAGDDYDPRAAVAQMRGTAALVEAAVAEGARGKAGGR